MSIMEISKVKVTDLKEKYGTPLYVYDERNMKEVMRAYKENFKSDLFETEVIYASKAFNVIEMVKLVKEEGLSLDCVSYGEMYTALKAGFDMKKVYVHGNNKSIEELEFAIERKSKIVVDNLDELETLIALDKPCEIYIRINVGVDAHTHKYIVTSHIDSKFGVIYKSEDFNKMMELINSQNKVKFLGFHAHIGSQIFDMSGFYAEIDKLIDFSLDFNEPIDLDLGGGFGIRYTDKDAPIPLGEVSKMLIEHLESKIKETGAKINKVLIEPGRSIVAESGYTLYTIGFTKKTPNKEYYFIDGGMTDNIRPALYQAEYKAIIGTKFDLEKTKKVCVAGKCCESGDIILEGCDLQEAGKGDILVTYSTGAYGYSMSSNYNKALTPAVVFVENGNSRLVVRRQTYDELIERELN